MSRGSLQKKRDDPLIYHTEVQEKEKMELVRGRNLYVLRDLISLRRGRAFAAKNRKVEDHLMRQALKNAMMRTRK